jgi:hypothetical protein
MHNVQAEDSETSSPKERSVHDDDPTYYEDEDEYSEHDYNHNQEENYKPSYHSQAPSASGYQQPNPNYQAQQAAVPRNDNSYSSQSAYAHKPPQSTNTYRPSQPETNKAPSNSYAPPSPPAQQPAIYRPESAQYPAPNPSPKTDYQPQPPKYSPASVSSSHQANPQYPPSNSYAKPGLAPTTPYKSPQVSGIAPVLLVPETSPLSDVLVTNVLAPNNQPEQSPPPPSSSSSAGYGVPQKLVSKVRSPYNSQPGTYSPESYGGPMVYQGRNVSANSKRVVAAHLVL